MELRKFPQGPVGPQPEFGDPVFCWVGEDEKLEGCEETLKITYNSRDSNDPNVHHYKEFMVHVLFINKDMHSVIVLDRLV